MARRLAAGELAMGTVVLAPGEEVVEILGYEGFDFVVVDLSVSSTDWSQAASMVRAAREYGVTPWVRLPAYPWAAHGAVDAGLAANALRAIAIGAECVTASANTAPQVAALLAPAQDWHRRPYLWKSLSDSTPLQDYYDGSERPPLIFPVLESSEAIENLDEIIALPELRALFLGLGDLSNDLGHPFDDRHPEVRRVVADVVARAAARDVAVFANVLSYADPERATVESVSEGVRWLWDTGVRAVWLPNPWFVVQRHFHRLALAVQELLPSAYPHRLESRGTEPVAFTSGGPRFAENPNGSADE